MKRYTTKTDNAYLNQYGLEVYKNTETSKHNSNQMYLGYWYVTEAYPNSSKRYVLTYAPTLTEAVEQAQCLLFEGRPATAIQLGNNSCELPLPADIWEAEFVTGQYSYCDLHQVSIEQGLRAALKNTEYYIEGQTLYHINGLKVGSFTQKRCQHLFNPFTSSANNSYPSWVDALKAAITWFEEYHLSCPVSFNNPVITKSQALDLRFCFQYYNRDIQVYRPDGTSFYADNVEQALAWIADGTHLCAYTEPPYCDIVITPLLSGTVPSTVSYWSEADATPQTRVAKEATLLTALGYDPDEYWVDLSTDEIYTLDGDVLVGTTSEQRWK